MRLAVSLSADQTSPQLSYCCMLRLVEFQGKGYMPCPGAANMPFCGRFCHEPHVGRDVRLGLSWYVFMASRGSLQGFSVSSKAEGLCREKLSVQRVKQTELRHAEGARQRKSLQSCFRVCGTTFVSSGTWEVYKANVPKRTSTNLSGAMRLKKSVPMRHQSPYIAMTRKPPTSANPPTAQVGSQISLTWLSCRSLWVLSGCPLAALGHTED